MTTKAKGPLLLKMLFYIGIAGFLFNTYYWEPNFYKTFATQKSEIKTQEFISHGNTYYVNADDYRKAKLIRWVTMSVFCLSILSNLIYIYKTRPGYFSLNKKREV